MLNERIIGTPKTTDVQERSATTPAATLRDNWSLERREWSRVKREGAASAMRGIRRSLKLLQMRVTARRKKERRGEGRGRGGVVQFISVDHKREFPR